MNVTFHTVALLAALLVVANGNPTFKNEFINSLSLNSQKWTQALSTIRSQFLGGGSDHSLAGSRISFDENEGDTPSTAFCELCEFITERVLSLYRSGVPNSIIGNTVLEMCVSLDIVPVHICRGMIDLNFPILFYIISQSPNLTTSTFCGTVFQKDLCVIDDAGRNLMEWSINIDGSNDRPANESKKATPAIQPDLEPLTIVHITDTHTDPLYAAGSLADCAEPVCCREGLLGEVTGFPNQTAGRWGDYRNCDSPWEATLNVFEQIKLNHRKIDLVYFTGDIIDHFVWATTASSNADTITKTFDALKAAFGDIPVLPIIGNHEPHPANQFAPSTQTDNDLESRSMYALLAENWRKWLPADALTTVLQSGYYTTLVRPGLRVIGLNNNDGSSENFWLLLDPLYVSRQLQWLHDTLLKAERDGEKVHILVHIPNNQQGMHSTYSREYQRIVERFWNTISAQFNGHTHRDQFYVFFDQKTTTKAINVAWNGGSATPYSNVNPNYRLYTVEPETFQVVNHQTWIYNLTEANQNAIDTPRWFQEYTFADEFMLSDLSPHSLDQLLTRFSRDEQALQRYWQFKVKQGDPSLLNGCDKYCLAAELCSMATTVVTPGVRNSRCEQLLEQWAFTTSNRL